MVFADPEDVEADLVGLFDLFEEMGEALLRAESDR